MRLIDADALKLYATGGVTSVGLLTLAEIDNAPTIDAVPVVRCKDCNHYHAELGWCDEHSHFIDADGDFCHPFESSNWKMFEPDYFCADGEWKGNDGNG